MTAATAPGAPRTTGRFDAARKVADTVLFEGYVLYPYRASSAKNRMRWQFGVLVPPAWGADSREHSLLRTECLMEPRSGTHLRVELRFLHVRHRAVQRVGDGGAFHDTDRLELADRVLLPWDEGVEETVELRTLVSELLEEEVVLPFTRPARRETEPLRDEAGRIVGRLVRDRERIDGVVRLTATELPGPYRVMRLSAVVENTGGWGAGADSGDRSAALARSLVSAHLMLGLSAGSFVSMTDPPEWAGAAVAECRNEHVWPVLAGAAGGSDVVLASPIILEDHPHIAPESLGPLYDATEIDEILALRTATLTEEEKREARGTDERAAAVIDLADSMPPEVLERLHGAVRGLREVIGPDEPASSDTDPAVAPVTRPDTPWWDPAADRSVDPAHDRVLVDGRPVGAGDSVVLHPGLRRTDAQDLFLRGRRAFVEAVLHDVDGGVHLAVTVEGDPGTDLRRAQGRFWYFQPDEVRPLEDLRAPQDGPPTEGG